MDRIYPYEDAPSFDLSADVLVAGFGGTGAGAGWRFAVGDSRWAVPRSAAQRSAT
jgi:hypothetical protein